MIYGKMIPNDSQVFERVSDCAIEGCCYYPSMNLVAIRDANSEEFTLEIVCDKHYEELMIKYYKPLSRSS
jgi:hypothetical protein